MYTFAHSPADEMLVTINYTRSLGSCRYEKVVPHPIDFGMVISKIAEARYRTIQDVINDVELLAANCKTYWGRFRKQSDVTVRSSMSTLHPIQYARTHRTLHPVQLSA